MDLCMDLWPDHFDDFGPSLSLSGCIELGATVYDEGLSSRTSSRSFDDLLLMDCLRHRRGGVLADSFDVFSLDDSFVKSFFRFGSAQDLQHLCELFSMPAEFRARNGTKATGLDVLCVVLRRLAYPCRYVDLCALFPFTETELCLLFNLGIDFLYGRFAHKLTSLDQPWLSPLQLQQYAAAVAAKGAPLQNCWGFIDGTVRPICRPNVHQREVFNGHKRVHGLKFQSIVTPNGLVANMFDPMEGRRHDAALLNESGVLAYMEAHFSVGGQPLCVYGDPAYPLRPHLMRPYRGHHLTQEQQQFNTRMSSVRQEVEWGFNKIITEWAFLDLKKNLKLFMSPVGKLYLVGAFLTNCHTCMYGSAVGEFFDVSPPALEDYVRV